jgi:hypothetical protein
MSGGSALKGFLGLIWRILEGIRKVLHLALMLIIFGFVLAALHTSNPIVPRSAHSARPRAARIRRPSSGT